MQKVLRSLIHEQLPEELRFQIALLSRRRDIINAEKQEELFKLLREYNIEGITPLGSGTNRYAFKLNGFVIKVATDHDGIIDNLKEFKMAKRLYPHVTKIYEVSENGTLLVAEYIQPFSSYGEMYAHADQIREILSNFSSVYLIGDVGVTQKNYANWGLRVGSDSPVCLDFAYVYDVSSELFICRKCKTNSMLVPDKDFVKLMCPAKGCGAVYEFSDIRRRIGNDLHRQEIGDLSKEGYLLDDSNVLTELTPERSNYLEEKKEPEKVSEAEEEIVIPDNFELEDDIQFYNSKEGIKMNLETSNMNMRANVIKANVIMPAAEEEVAFSGTLNDDPTIIKAYVITEDTVIQTPDPVEETPAEEEPVAVEAEPAKVEDGERYDTPITAEELKAVAAEVDVSPIVDLVEEVKEQLKVEPVKESTNKFSKRFIDGAHFAVSNIGKMVQEQMTQELFFDEIKSYINQKKFYAGDFYKVISTAIYKAIIGFCNFQQIELPNKDKPGTHRGYKAPEKIAGEIYEPTMVFLQRTFIDERLNHCETITEMMNKYHEFYGDFAGLQREIIPSLRLELTKRLKMSGNGINVVINKLDSLLVIPQEVEDIRLIAEAFVEAEAEPDTSLKEELDKQIEENPEVGDDSLFKFIPKEAAEVINNSVETNQEIISDAAKTIKQEVDSEVLDTPVEEVPDEVVEAEPETPDEEVAFSTEIADDEYEVEEVEPTYIPTVVEVYDDGDTNVIRLKTADAFGEVIIPFYKNLKDVDPTKTIPSMVDDRNGEWDWLIHFAPMMRFYTTDPDKWLEVNCGVEENQVHPVILDELEDGRYVMGLYLIDGMYSIDNDGNYTPIDDIEVVKKINSVILDGISTGDISHLKRTVDTPEGIYEESSVADYLVDGDSEEEDAVENTEAENAAIAAMFDDAEEEIDPAFFAEETPAENNMIFTPVHRPTKND